MVRISKFQTSSRFIVVPMQPALLVAALLPQKIQTDFALVETGISWLL